MNKETEIVIMIISVIIMMLISGIFLIVSGDCFNIILGIVDIIIDILFGGGIVYNIKKAFGG